MRANIILGCALSLLVGGCASREVHFWPVVSIEKEKAIETADPHQEDSHEKSDGTRVQVLWPIFEHDNTGSAVRHAVRPLYSYDGETRKGSILWPMVRYGFASEEDRYLNVLPLYYSGHNTNRNWMHFIPLAGRVQGDDQNLWYILPYVHSEKGAKRFNGLMVPPLLFGENTEKNTKWGVVLNYIYNTNPRLSYRHFIPLVFQWSEPVKLDLAETNSLDAKPISKNTMVLLFFFRNVIESPEGERLGGAFYLGPLYGRDWGHEHSKQVFGILPWWDFDWGYLTALYGRSKDGRNNREGKRFDLFPFYSSRSEGEYFKRSLPGLGMSRWYGGKSRLGVGGENRGWAWWPVFGYSKGLSREGEETREAFGWQTLAGFSGYAKNGTNYNLQLLCPLQKVSRRGSEQHNRFWPLYRYTRDENKTDFAALAEIFAWHHGQDWRDDWRFLLHPVSYQKTRAGGHDFRFLWKLIESRSREGESIAAFNPLYYRRHGTDASRNLFLGGFLGWGREEEKRFMRLLWFFDIPLSEAN